VPGAVDEGDAQLVGALYNMRISEQVAVGGEQKAGTRARGTHFTLLIFLEYVDFHDGVLRGLHGRNHELRIGIHMEYTLRRRQRLTCR
jgi:hypothetical protein